MRTAPLSPVTCPLSPGELRSFLKRYLPDYMIPSAFVVLEVFPLTPNGKVDRKALAAPNRAQLRTSAAFCAPRTSTEQVLAEIWSQVLEVAQVGIHDNFFRLGGDSLLSMQVAARTGRAGLRLTPKQLFEHQTIAELAAVVSSYESLPTEQEVIDGVVRLTPVQRWLFDNHLPSTLYPPYWISAQLFEVRQPLDPALLERAVHHLLFHHDALRLRFAEDEYGWHQFMAGPHVAVPFLHVVLSGVPAAQQRTTIVAEVTKLRARLNLAEGPLFLVALLDLGADAPNYMLILAHHLLLDDLSWNILLEDLQPAYEQLSQGQAVRLPPQTTSFKQWAERLQTYGQSDALQQERDYWLTVPLWRASRLPRDFPTGTNAMADMGQVKTALSVEESRTLLHEVPAAYDTQINTVLLTALAQAYAQWTGERVLLVDVWGHGRWPIFDDVDLSRTVGWCSSVCPTLLDLGASSTPQEMLRAVQAQISRIPNYGIGYGVLRYLGGDAEAAARLRALPRPEITFNYHGQLRTSHDRALIRPATDILLGSITPAGDRAYLLDIGAQVVEEQFTLMLLYSPHVHRRSTIERLAEAVVGALRSLIQCYADRHAC